VTLFSFARHSLRLWAGGIMLWCGVVFAWIGGAGMQSERRYRDAARVARAEVVAKSLHPATSNTSTRYEILYRVALPDGATVERAATVDVVEWERLEQGASLDAQYLPGDHESVRLAREPHIAGNAAMAALGGVLASMGAVLLTLGARDVRRKTRLYRQGTPAVATVVAIEETNVRINRKPQWRIRFRYADRVGQERQGVSGYMAAAHAHAWKRGDIGVVRFDPAHPEHVLWIGQSRELP
jgi:hypothetical protein